MSEDGEEDAVHGSSILEDAHGPGAATNLAEAALDGVGGPHGFAGGGGLVAEAGEQLIEVVAQAADGFGVVGFPMVGAAACGGAGLGEGLGLHDGMKVGLDGRLIGDTHLGEDIPDLVRPAALNGDAGIDERQGGEETLAAIDTDHLEPRAGEAAAIEIGEKLLPLRRTLARGQAVIDDLLLAIRAEAEGHQHRPPDRPGAGLARKHHAVEHEDGVLVLERAAVERCHGGIEDLGDFTDCCGADPPAEHRQQSARDLARGEPQHEARQDHAIDVSGAPGIGAHHGERAVAPRARHAELDVAQLGQQVAGVRPVAPIGLTAFGHLFEVTVDRGLHPAGQNRLQGVSGRPPIVLTPFDPCACMAFIIRNARAKLSIVAPCGIGRSSCELQQPTEYLPLNL